MSNSSATSKPRGRRAAPKVPCDECIQRASKSRESNIELCENCTAVLHRPRKIRKEKPTTRKIRRQSHAIIDTALGIRTDQISLPWTSDRQEQHALQLFVRYSTQQLAGYFDSPFWQRIVLLAARDESSVLHAVAAIGALHDTLLASAVNPTESQDRRNHFALEQCNKSMQHLIQARDGRDEPDIRLMLTTCVLYTCIEALQGNCEQAIIHTTQGYNLLQQYALNPSDEQWDIGPFAAELDQLCIQMRRLWAQSEGLAGDESCVERYIGKVIETQPTSFDSVNQARSSLEPVLSYLTALFLNLEVEDEYYQKVIASPERRHFTIPQWLLAWETAFAGLLARQGNISISERRAAMVLKAHQLVASVLANVDLSLGEFGWDVFYDEFAAIVNLATAVLVGTEQPESRATEESCGSNDVFKSPPSATSSIELSIIDPLYEVVIRCRDPVLRHKALDLLAAHPQQECIWFSWSAWKVGKLLVRLEEDGMDSRYAVPDVQAAHCINDNSSNQHALELGPDHMRAVPHASARYELNPGLFDWRTNEPTLIPNLKFSTITTTDRASGGSPLQQKSDIAEKMASSYLPAINGSC